MTTSRLHSLDIRLLRAFAVVAEENNISRAAQRLFISQPPLTRHIRHLEAQLGVTLFQRHSKGLILTDAGRRGAGDDSTSAGAPGTHAGGIE